MLSHSGYSVRGLLLQPQLKDRSRRDFLKAGTAAAVVYSCGTAAAAQIQQAGSDGYPASKLQPFPLSFVRLSPGVFKEQADINTRYLDSLAVDRLLHSFRMTAGISSRAVPYGGWEDPTCELRGHFAGGHVLSALALASCTSADSSLKARGGELVSALAECQQRMGSGYLGAFPPDLFEHLVQGKAVWAPFYTYHKIMAGLLDMHQLAANSDALPILEGMARWVGDYFAGISAEQRQHMLRTEYGGMNEVLVNLAALTQKERYLDTARLFEQPGFLDALAQRRDELQGLHANTHVPKVIGAARMYEVTGERRYRQIAEYFLEEVLVARNYAIGNTSLDENWNTPPGQLQGTLAWKNAECCVAYNLMKLQRLVFGWTGQARWMDEYERSLFNCRLGTQDPHGLKQYFFPLAAGYWRAYHSPEQSFWCCTGTGAEEFAKLTDTIFFHRGSDIYVNQFIASSLEWKEEGLTVEQVTQFPREQGMTLKVTSSRPMPRTIYVRIPGWSGTPEIRLNGRLLAVVAEPGSYIGVRQVWRSGDTISVQLRMELRQEALPGDESVRAVLYGPLILAADFGAGPADGPARVIHGRSTAPDNIPPPDPLPEVAAEATAREVSWVELQSKQELRFRATAAGARYAVAPLYRIAEQRYSIYWQTHSSNRRA
jgi:uncharacterized protein